MDHSIRMLSVNKCFSHLQLCEDCKRSKNDWLVGFLVIQRMLEYDPPGMFDVFGGLVLVFLKSLMKHWISMSNQKWILL